MDEKTIIMNLSAHGSSKASDTANLESNFRITDHYLNGALLQAKHAKVIENKYLKTNLTEIDRYRHMSYSIASLVQTVGALEAEFTYVLRNGLGARLDSDSKVGEQIHNSVDWLKAVKTNEKDITIPKKFEAMLNTMKLEPINGNPKLILDLELVCKIRNQLTHYNGFTNSTLETKKFVKDIAELNLGWPPWSANSSFPFPHRYVGWALSIWALKATATFLGVVYTTNFIDMPLNLKKLISKLSSLSI